MRVFDKYTGETSTINLYDEGDKATIQQWRNGQLTEAVVKGEMKDLAQEAYREKDIILFETVLQYALKPIQVAAE
jgi:hypothetical protein